MEKVNKISENLRELLRLAIELESLMYGIMRRAEAKLKDDYNGF